MGAGRVDSTITTDEGQALFVRDWSPTHPDARRLGVFIMHGLGEHSGRYTHVAKFFQDCGLHVRAYDHRGHGRSAGGRGDVPDDEAILRDARFLLNDFAKHLDAPPLLFGHSMGGLFAARFATGGLAPIRGLILSSPALAIYISDFQRGLAKVLKALIPGLGIANGLKLPFLTHDAKVIAAYKNDPLVHSKISARLLTAMLDAMDYVHDHASQLRIPILLLVASDDQLVDPIGAERFVARLAPEYVDAHFYAGFYHEIFNEVDAAQVFADLQTWLQKQKFCHDSGPLSP